MLVMFVATAKNHFEEQVLVAGTKQSRQTDKAGSLTRKEGRLTRQSGMLLCFVPATSALVLLNN